MSSASGGPCALVRFGEIETHGDAQVDDYIELPPIDSSDEEDVDEDDAPGVPEMRERARGGREIIIGRQKEKVDHAMDSTAIPLLLSRKHAALLRKGKAHYVRDLATTNGTFVNGKRIDAKVDVELRDNDVVSFGGPRYVARDAGKQANPFRFRYVRLERRGVDERRKRARLSQDSDGGLAMDMSQDVPASQLYRAIHSSQASESEFKVDDELKTELRELFEKNRDLAERCAERYFGSASPSTLASRGMDDRRGDDLVNRSVPHSQNDSPGALPDELTQKISDKLVASLRKPDWVDTDLKCAICHEWLTLPHTLVGCGHMFCLECIDNAFCHGYSCPCCRSQPQAPRKLLFTKSTLAAKLLDAYVLPFLTTSELLERKAREVSALEAREKRLKREAELVSSALQESMQETQRASPHDN